MRDGRLSLDAHAAWEARARKVSLRRNTEVLSSKKETFNQDFSGVEEQEYV